MTEQKPISELIRGGAHSELVGLVYDELRSLARVKMAQERANHTLQATALVNEAWIRLFESGYSVRFDNRTHFFGAAAEAMRRILVDRARKHNALKRGGGRQVLSLAEADLAASAPPDDVTGVSEALEALEAVDPRAALIVKLRFFIGFRIEEVAEILEVSPTTVKADWTASKAWLRRRLRPGDDASSAEVESSG